MITLELTILHYRMKASLGPLYYQVHFSYHTGPAIVYTRPSKNNPKMTTIKITEGNTKKKGGDHKPPSPDTSIPKIGSPVHRMSLQDFNSLRRQINSNNVEPAVVLQQRKYGIAHPATQLQQCSSSCSTYRSPGSFCIQILIGKNAGSRVGAC